jgi:hypothetical protein
MKLSMTKQATIRICPGIFTVALPIRDADRKVILLRGHFFCELKLIGCGPHIFTIQE